MHRALSVSSPPRKSVSSVPAISTNCWNDFPACRILFPRPWIVPPSAAVIPMLPPPMSYFSLMVDQCAWVEATTPSTMRFSASPSNSSKESRSSESRSVLYGTNAFEGVFNIITKKTMENRFGLEAEAGSFSSRLARLSFYGRRGDFSIIGGIHYLDTEGWPYQSAVSGEPGQTFSKDVFQDNIGLHTRLVYKDLTLAVTLGSIKQFTVVSLCRR